MAMAMDGGEGNGGHGGRVAAPVAPRERYAPRISVHFCDHTE